MLNMDKEIIIAAQDNNYNKLKKLINSGANVNAADKDGVSLICHASYHGNYEAVKLLHLAGASVDSITNYGATPLIYAAEHGHLNIVKYLIENKADINACNKKKLSALHYATHNGHLDIVQYLIANGAEVDIQDKVGGSPLLIATLLSNEEIVRVLLNAGATTDIYTITELTPIMLAKELGNTEILNLLINSQNNDPIVNLHKAAYRGDTQEIERLIKHGAPINAIRKMDGASALVFAARNEHTETVKFLVENGADVNITPRGMPLIAYIAQIGNIEIAEILLPKVKDINVSFLHPITGRKTNSLDVAIRMEKTEMAKFLVKNGANMNFLENEITIIIIDFDNLNKIIDEVKETTTEEKPAIMTVTAEQNGISFSGLNFTDTDEILL